MDFSSSSVTCTSKWCHFLYSLTNRLGVAKILSTTLSSLQGKNQMDISILVPAIAPDLSKLLLLSPHEAMVTGAKMEIIHRIGDTGTTSKMIQFNLIHSNHILVHELLYTFC